MKHGLLIATLVAALSLSMLSPDAEAKRIGSGGSAGMKRSVPTQPASPTPQQGAAPQGAGVPAQQAAPSPAGPGAAPAAAPKRSWMGPIAGLAAGLGIAALASHFGMGGALANVMTMLLIGVALMFVVGFVMRRFAAKPAQDTGLQYAAAGAGSAAGGFGSAAPVPAALASAPVTAAAPANAEDEEFVQIAKRVFIRLQAANDAGDQNDLRKFTTPEMYAAVQQDLLERKSGTQRTDVLQLNAQLLDRAQEQGQQVVSVRFWGLIREQSDAAAENFDEIWHLVRPLDASREWAIAGIQQTQ